MFSMNLLIQEKDTERRKKEIFSRQLLELNWLETRSTVSNLEPASAWLLVSSDWAPAHRLLFQESRNTQLKQKKKHRESSCSSFSLVSPALAVVEFVQSALLNCTKGFKLKQNHYEGLIGIISYFSRHHFIAFNFSQKLRISILKKVV